MTTEILPFDVKVTEYLSLISDQFAKLAVMLYENVEKAGYFLDTVKLSLPSYNQNYSL